MAISTPLFSAGRLLRALTAPLQQARSASAADATTTDQRPDSTAAPPTSDLANDDIDDQHGVELEPYPAASHRRSGSSASSLSSSSQGSRGTSPAPRPRTAIDAIPSSSPGTRASSPAPSVRSSLSRASSFGSDYVDVDELGRRARAIGCRRRSDAVWRQYWD